MIKPIKGFEDMVIHGDKTGFAYFDKSGKELYYTVREFAEILKSSGLYQGGNIRLWSYYSNEFSRTIKCKSNSSLECCMGNARCYNDNRRYTQFK